ncbi:MAG TPA: efflux RND transporter periplasmic adaptor subunit [Phycisphaerae bacterium]|nr:efflux RND transporter periplasmic adaptor subunit [Phycisphaerae bacterium]
MYAKPNPSTVAAILSAASALVVAAVANAQAPTPVRTESVSIERVQEHRRVTGSLQAVARSSVPSQESGQVLTVSTDEGMRVAEGDIIAQLDDRRLKSQLEETLARIARTESELVERESELEFAEFERLRLTNLREGHEASERELKVATTDFGAAQARVEAAKRAILEGQHQAELLRIRIDDMTVRAPFDARVVKRHVDPGEWLEPGEPIVTLVSTGAIEARLEVPERFADPVVQFADQIFADVIGVGQTVPSTGLRIIPDVDPQARSFSVILTLDNPDGLMSPGMSVVAWIPTGEEAEQLTVPKAAVTRNGKDAYVYRTQNKDGKTTAARTPVTVLFNWAGRAIVESDELKNGDKVIVEGNERLMPGASLAQAEED